VRFYVGTSGFSYAEWRGAFYPEGLSQKKMLPFYAEHLDTVELNNTFYRAPTKELLESWASQVPDGFRFSLKAQRFVSHAVRRGDVRPASHFISLAGALKDKLGAILIQLPPMKKNIDALRSFVRDLPRDREIVFELRDASWFSEDVYETLRNAGCALCITEGEDLDTPWVFTADFAYFRLRRTYNDAALAKWAEEISGMPASHAYVFFKHKGTKRGPAFAKKMRALLMRRLSPSTP